MTQWAPFVALSLGPLADHVSLRYIVTHLAVQSHQRYHLEIHRVSRALLARVNQQPPHTWYAALFYKRLCRCPGRSPHSIVVFDRGYTDYTWYQHLHDYRIHFVTRQKSHATYAVVARWPVSKATGLT